ncbi:MAG: hypothetical protein IJW40_08820 [Clostridia bacterium]|nr:hypothetical protein [Clostridia bacterium]
MAIEAREYTEKDELIGQFYALRAGLSAIAQETQEIHEIEEKIYETKGAVGGRIEDIEDETEEEIDSIQQTVWQEESKLRLAQKFVDRAREERDSYIEVGAIKRHKSEVKGIKANIGCFSWVIIFCCISWVCTGIAVIVEGSIEDGLMIFAGGLGLLLVLGIIKACKSHRLKINYLDEKYRKNAEWVNECMRQVDEQKENVDAAKRELSQKQSELTEITTKKKQLMAELQALEIKRDTQVLPMRTGNVKQITAAMHQQFDHLVTEADWQNVDLLIFYLETGRADSLKEALLLVDQQRQTDQIVEVAGVATQHIASAVHTASMRLGAALYSGFRDLGARIDQNHRKILSSIDQHNATMADLGERIGDLTRQVQAQGDIMARQTQSLIDAERLNGALLEKANQNSDELMRELRYNQKYWIK